VGFICRRKIADFVRIWLPTVKDFFSVFFWLAFFNSDLGQGRRVGVCGRRDFGSSDGEPCVNLGGCVSTTLLREEGGFFFFFWVCFSFVWKAPVFEHQQEGIWGWCWEVVKLLLPLKGFLIECAKKRCAIVACGGGPNPWVEK
jgi:hypothetical protein